MPEPHNIDGVLIQWGDRLFYPGNRIVKTKPQPKLSALAARQRAAVIRERIEATAVRRAPQVMVKVTGGGRGMKAIAAHLRYISKNGRLEIEDERGQMMRGKDALRELADDWRFGGSLIDDTSSRREAFNIMLSMPRGADPASVQWAAREFAKAELADHKYVMVLHDHQANPHVHIRRPASAEVGASAGLSEAVQPIDFEDAQAPVRDLDDSLLFQFLHDAVEGLLRDAARHDQIFLRDRRVRDSVLAPAGDDVVAEHPRQHVGHTRGDEVWRCRSAALPARVDRFAGRSRLAEQGHRSGGSSVQARLVHAFGGCVSPRDTLPHRSAPRHSLALQTPMAGCVQCVASRERHRCMEVSAFAPGGEAQRGRRRVAGTRLRAVCLRSGSRIGCTDCDSLRWSSSQIRLR